MEMFGIGQEIQEAEEQRQVEPPHAFVEDDQATYAHARERPGHGIAGGRPGGPGGMVENDEGAIRKEVSHHQPPDEAQRAPGINGILHAPRFGKGAASHSQTDADDDQNLENILGGLVDQTESAHGLGHMEGGEQALQNEPHGTQRQGAETPEDKEVINPRVFVADHALLNKRVKEDALQPLQRAVEAVVWQACEQGPDPLAGGIGEETQGAKHKHPKQSKL